MRVGPRVCMAAVALFAIAAPGHAFAADPDLSAVRLEVADLPSGFRLVPDTELEDVGGSAKQVGEALERSLEIASLQQYQVYASSAGDELIELVVVGPLIPAERAGMLQELTDPAAVADNLSPSFTLYVEQSDPQLIDSAGIGDGSVGYQVDSRVTSDLATATNILGVPWTAATTRFLIGLRGDYVMVMMTQYVGADAPSVDLLGNARHVDAHLAAALGLAEPGVYRPGGTFSPSVANNIPTIGDISTEPSVAFANLVLTAIAVIVLTAAMRLLNTTLVRHEGALERLLRPARALGRGWSAADQAIGERLGGRAGVVRVVGVLLFYGVLFSFLEDGWRPWTASGLFLLLVMTVAFGAVGTTDDMVELRAARRWGLPARLAVKPALVLIAVGSVALTKFAQLVPGLMIGTPEAFSLEDEVDADHELRLARVGLVTTAAVGLGAWVLATPLDAQLDGSSGSMHQLVAAIVTLLVLVFAVAVENLFANMMAFPGSEGATLRRHHRVVWWCCMVGVTVLFFHTLINPRGDLAQSLESTNVQVVLATVATFLVFTIGVYLWFRRADRSVSAPVMDVPIEPALPGVATVPIGPSVEGVGLAADQSHLLPPSAAAAMPAPIVAAMPQSSIGAGPAVLRATRARRRRDPVRTVRLVVTGIAVLGLVALVAVVVRQDQRDSERFDTAHQAYLAADCAAAVNGYDTLLDDDRLIDTAGVVEQATRERDECLELVAIDQVAETDPAAALLGYAHFVTDHPDAELSAAVGERVAVMLAGSSGSQVASEQTCDGLEEVQAVGILDAADLPQVQVWCAEVYEAVGRDSDAYEMAIVVLESTAGTDVIAGAEAIALHNAQACADVDRLRSLTGLQESEAQFVAFLQRCMSSDAALADVAVLAELQIAFLATFPGHPDAPAVELALIGNYAACDHLEQLRSDSNIAARVGFIPTIMLTCAQTAEFFQDFDAAIERYQWFIDNAPADERVVAARDGLARSLIAEAEQGGAGSLPQPTDTGGTGSTLASVAIYNDSPEELRVVMSGPESRIEYLVASATSSEYDLVGPLSCRTDVPRLELQVPAGDYRVLVEATGGGIDPFTGTWTLGSGDAYSSCFYIVTTFG